jgi:hypothetical protein
MTTAQTTRTIRSDLGLEMRKSHHHAITSAAVMSGKQITIGLTSSRVPRLSNRVVGVCRWPDLTCLGLHTPP